MADSIDAPHPQLHDVFVSYASPDVQIADELVALLERQGLRCWIAPRDVAPGGLYADAIIRAINAAKALVLLLSAQSVASPHVGKEIERASAKRRPILALRTDAAGLTPAHPRPAHGRRGPDAGPGIFPQRVPVDRRWGRSAGGGSRSDRARLAPIDRRTRSGIGE
jgi:hypothetical protein